MTVNNVSGSRYPGGVIMYANDKVYDEKTKTYKQNDINSITAIEFKGEESYKLAYQVMHGKAPDTNSDVFNAFKKEMNKAADRANDANEGKVTTLSYGDVLVLSQHAKTKAEVQQEIDAVEAAEEEKQRKMDDLKARKEQLAEDKLNIEKTNNTIKAFGIGGVAGGIAGALVGAAGTKVAVGLGLAKVAEGACCLTAMGPLGWIPLILGTVAAGGYLAYRYYAKPENMVLEEEQVIKQEEAALDEDNK